MIIRLVDKEDGGGRGFNEISKRDLGWENTNFQKRNMVQIGLCMKEVLKNTGKAHVRPQTPNLCMRKDNSCKQDILTDI